MTYGNLVILSSVSRNETFTFFPPLYLVDPASNICLSQRLSHAKVCVASTMKLQTAH